MKIFGYAILAMIVTGCATPGPALLESTISLDHSSELQFREYEYTDAERKSCQADRKTCYLNGFPALGATDTLPESYLAGLTLKVADEQYDLETSHMYNPMLDKRSTGEDDIQYFSVICLNAINCTIRGIFAEAGDFYVAEWVIVEGKPLRTVLSPSSDVVEAFIDNIAPPAYE